MTPLELIMLRGPGQSGKSTVARELATRLEGKSAVVSIDDLLSRWIVTHDTDIGAEDQMVYRQVRLLVSGYLRGGYHTVVEGSFVTLAGAAYRSYDAELSALRNLMATIPGVRARVFTLTAPLEELRRRAGGVPHAVARVDALFAAYSASRLRDATDIDTSSIPVNSVVDLILGKLQ